jgi:hypothetical protein
MSTSRRRALVAGWVVILLAAGLYLATLDSGLRPDELSGGDLITHQYAQAQARPGNAPGYPLYTVGGWLWFRLTRPLTGWFLNPIQRLSSYSTLWALLSLYLLYRLSLRAARGNWPIAALCTAFYAATYFFWYYSVTTEQYTSAVFQTLLIVWLAFQWEDTRAAGRHGDGYLLALALVLGTCLANLVTTLFIVPPLAWFILSRQPGLIRRPALLVRGAVLALLPLLSYAYVYWQGAAHPEWRGAGEWPSTWAWFVDFLTTQQGRDELAPGLTLAQFFTPEYPALIWGELTGPVLVGGLAGLGWLGRRRALFLYGTLGMYALFSWADRFGNWYQVILPAYPLIVLGLAAGSSDLWERTWPSPGWRPAVRALLTAALVGLVAYRFALSLPRADQSDRPEDTALAPGWAVLADAPRHQAVVVAGYEEWLALQYLAHVWGAQPPVRAFAVCSLSREELAEAPKAVSSDSAVYLTRTAAAADPSCLADRPHYAAGANLIRVQLEPNTQLPPSARPADLAFGKQLVLAGFEINTSAAEGDHGGPGDVWHLSVYWRAAGSMDTDYIISVRPLRGGQMIHGQDSQPLIQDHQPVWNTYPTTRWTPGEIVRDDYVLTLPAQVVPDAAYIIVYRATPAGFDNLAEGRLELLP